MKKNNKNSKINWIVLISSFVIVFIFSFIGSKFTKIDSWYYSIRPALTPPDFLFGIVWTILFILIAVSLYYAWINCAKRNRLKLILYYGTNLLLNVLWSYIFFTMRDPRFAFAEIIILELSIVFLIYFNWTFCKKAAYLLIPYLLWVCFAIILNYLSLIKWISP